MQHEIIGELHEATVTVKLTDAPLITHDRGEELAKPLSPRNLIAFWVKENAGGWELMSITINGHGQSVVFWDVAGYSAPDWARKIVDQYTPVTVLESRTS